MITDACEFVATRLRDAGLDAVHDPRDLNLPGVWITPGDITLNRLQAGAGSIDVIVAFVAPDAGGLDTLTILDGMLAKGIAADVGIITAESGTVQLHNHAPDGLPALISTVSIDIP